MILLSDVEDDGQRMVYCPGLHEIKYANISDNISSKHTRLSKSFVNQFEKFNCSGRAGDVYIFFPNTPHTGTRNMTRRRDVI
jgi:hypothetical protein